MGADEGNNVVGGEVGTPVLGCWVGELVDGDTEGGNVPGVFVGDNVVGGAVVALMLGCWVGGVVAFGGKEVAGALVGEVLAAASVGEVVAEAIMGVSDGSELREISVRVGDPVGGGVATDVVVTIVDDGGIRSVRKGLKSTVPFR